jgi:hypothetical protein
MTVLGLVKKATATTSSSNGDGGDSATEGRYELKGFEGLL